MAPPTASRLREELRVDRRRAKDDGYGNSIADWTVLIPRRYASVEPLKGGEQVIAQRAQGVALYDIWLRYDDATQRIGAGDRLVDLLKGQTFNVQWAEDWERRRRWIRIQAESGVADDG